MLWPVLNAIYIHVLPHSCLSVCDVLIFCDETAYKIKVNILDDDVSLKFQMCEELINIVLFYGFVHREVNKSSDLWVLRHSVKWQTQVKLTDLNSTTFKTCPQNALKYIKSDSIYCHS